MKESKIIHWDASIVIAWLKGETDTPLGRIESVLEQFEYGSKKLIFSVLIYPEILQSQMPEVPKETIDTFFDAKGIEFLAVDIRIAKKAQEIRLATGIKTPDAIHIATAIIAKANVLHTFDKKMLKLSETDAVNGLHITECTIPGEPDPLPL